MKYYIIAGEASGDLHAANLLKALKVQDPQAEFRAWGGDLMAAQGAHLVKHYRELAFMGFKEVIMNLPTIMRNLRFCKEDIKAWQPDVLIFVDYPGFNMRIAEWARKEGYKTVYYISPQVWAWKAGRSHKLKRDVDRMITILPFEGDFFKGYDFDTSYVGHPLLDVIPQFHPDPDFRQKHGLATEKPLIALLPGSRKQEILKKLPVMLAMQQQFPAYQFVIAGAPGQEPAFYQSLMQGQAIPIVFGKTYDLLSNSYAACVTSGTATLETALFGVPEVVCYKGSKLSYEIGRRLVKIKYISLVNLIMDRLVVKELIQDDLTEDKLAAELTRLTQDQEYRSKMEAEYRQLRELLGGSGASARAAKIISDFLDPALA